MVKCRLVQSSRLSQSVFLFPPQAVSSQKLCSKLPKSVPLKTEKLIEEDAVEIWSKNGRR